MTTPDPIELHKIFFELVKNNIEYVCMEVSAHAIYYNKLEGLKFEVMVFTNLTEDHLDFFKTMEEYFDAKKRIFNPRQVKMALINIDNQYGLNLIQGIKIPYYTYSIYNNSNYKAENKCILDREQKGKYKEYKQMERNFIHKNFLL